MRSSAIAAASPAPMSTWAKPAPSAAPCPTASAAACSTDTTVPSTTSPPIADTTSTTACRSAAASSAGSISARSLSARSVSALASAITSASPRRICDRITPELPRAPSAAPRASAAATSATSPEAAAGSASTNAERMVNSMLAPVSESATGKTLSRLISSAWRSRSPTAVWAQSCRAVASNRRSGIDTS